MCHNSPLANTWGWTEYLILSQDALISPYIDDLVQDCGKSSV